MKFRNPVLAALYAALYSWGLSAVAILSTMVGVGWSLGVHGGFTDWPSFVAFMKVAWFGGLLGLFFQIGPYARAVQAHSAAQNSNTLPPPEQNQGPVVVAQPPQA
jgi:hypothetical protein